MPSKVNWSHFESQRRQKIFLQSSEIISNLEVAEIVKNQNWVLKRAPLSWPGTSVTRIGTLATFKSLLQLVEVQFKLFLIPLDKISPLLMAWIGKNNITIWSHCTTPTTTTTTPFELFRNAWASLGEMTRPEAMSNFVEEVLKVMPHLKPYLEAQRKEEELKREAL